MANGSSADAVSSDRLPVALSVSPARVALDAPAARTIQLRNVGVGRVVVDVAPKPVDRHATALRWLSIRPSRVLLRAGSRALVTLRARASRGVRPGDHQLLVLLIARPLERSRVAVRIRLGVRVRVRMPGRIVRRLDVRGLRVRRQRARTRVLLLSVANAGNVTEELRGRVSLILRRGAKTVARLQPRGPSELYPGARTTLAARYAGRVRGLVTAVLQVRSGGQQPAFVRRYRIRL